SPGSTTRDPDAVFIRFEAPLGLLVAGIQFNKEQHSPDGCFTQLYVAQAPISTLPRALQADVPTPNGLAQGRFPSDIYGSSIWLGLEPTYTPWHRDPNPNLFCQLCGSKVVRTMPPWPGTRLFEEVQAKLGKGGSPRIRGEEMMQGPERRALLDAVWGANTPQHMIEVEVNPRDVLFIPKGWWHSVRSTGPGGGLNASVNWWFRCKAVDKEAAGG
ncbi:Clavaminate synthase-like protein, partial [Trichocladium antarcticum]